MIVSAYLSLLDDWDILKPALLSVIDRVDEIVVVDGAYRWMLPYFAQSNRDPSRSVSQVYDVLAELGPKIRVVNSVWDNEMEKRIAGYSACRGRYRYRVDADEIFFFDEDRTRRFFASGYAVGEMDMPTYIAPGLISGTPRQPLPRQCFLFDSDRISAPEHLGYLWLFLPEWERAVCGEPRPEFIFPEPLAFNAHLTHWRPPSSSLSRARFYVMNYLREHGGPDGKGIKDFTGFFKRLPPAAFDETLLGRPIVVLPPADQFTGQMTPLSPAQEAGFAYLHDRFLASLAALNGALLGRWRTIPRGEIYHLDATLPHSLPVAPPANFLAFEFSTELDNIKMELSTWAHDSARHSVVQLEAQLLGKVALVKLPELPAPGSFLRRTLTFTAWPQANAQFAQFRLLAVQQETKTTEPASPAASAAFSSYSAPSELALATSGPRAVLVVGSCLLTGLHEFIQNHKSGCESDYILFNNVAELPIAPPRPPEAYDFQLVQIGMRAFFSEHDYFRLTDSEPEAFAALFATVSERLKRVMASALRFNKAGGLLSFITNFLVPQQNPLGRLMPRYDLRNPVYFFEELNRVLAIEAASYINVHIFDIELLARQFGKQFIQDDAVWSLAHNAMLTDFDFEHDQARLHPPRPMSETYELRLLEFVRAMWAELVAHYRVVAQADAIKLVVTDLDDTLWRGVLAEQDQVDITMIEGWPLGLAEALLFLKRRGVILALASRNDEAIILRRWSEVFHGRLRLEDFAVRKINFLPKAENFAEILRETNILARSTLYIDDNPVERAAIASAFPQVRLLGQDPYLLKRILLWAPELQVPVITQEAARRTEMVQQQVVREAERAHLPRAEFLASLGLGVTLRQLAGEADPAFARAFELLNKTNQFNTTGRRWRREEAAAAFARGGAWYVFGVADRFTNYGLVGVVVTEGPEITQFVMSCRVAGLDVELAAIGEVARAIGEQGAELRASFLPTKENFLASTLFPAAGFSSRDDIWTANPASLPPPPSHILINWAAEQRAG